MSADDAPYYDLGNFHRGVTTSDASAQLWFDRGLVWSYGFNHEEAVRCFELAISHDEACSMAHWGLAYALGPNYNKPWSLLGGDERATVVARTHRAVVLAERHASTDLERALAGALRRRYPEPTGGDFSSWNVEYADAMAGVSASYPDDPDVSALYADAMMNLTPWALWDLRTGEPAPGARTLEIERVLGRALSLDGGSRHPGLLHLYIHLMEMSARPEAALPAADRLRDLVPDAGHLRHMPSHIDVLVGDYAAAVEANSRAVAADEAFLRRRGPRNFYTLYRAHDYHFRLYGAMFSGQSAVALDTVARLEETVTDDVLRIRSPPMADWLEAFLAMRVHALIRFGRWRDILDRIQPPPDRDLYCVTTAASHYARAMAHAALGEVADAEDQRRLFRSALARVKPSRTLFNNSCSDILAVAAALLDGEVEYRRASYEAAFEHLRESIRRYDALPYDEPWGWMQPARHAYGALLLEQGHVDDALAVYAADLGFDGSLPRAHQHPNNVWALHGYHECLVRLGREREAGEIKPKLDAALEVADVPIRSSCFCRRGVD
ncbi:to TPR Domain [Geosmithia morbida]|uniref:To TPR Domain n=1 Tax=Geosmithia morbida TaxID=1094350 RepID=A0A9P4Z0H1_9HYPO|nr:to TPR Domain [Geosmithia morbida]KAF4124379.1 to TPR Domain [Geosmithia morbida]